MVLYMEVLESNVADYIRTAEMLKGFLSFGSSEFVQLDVAIGRARTNLSVIESMRADGIKELEVTAKQG